MSICPVNNDALRVVSPGRIWVFIIEAATASVPTTWCLHVIRSPEARMPKSCFTALRKGIYGDRDRCRCRKTLTPTPARSTPTFISCCACREFRPGTAGRNYLELEEDGQFSAVSDGPTCSGFILALSPTTITGPRACRFLTGRHFRPEQTPEDVPVPDSPSLSQWRSSARPSS